MSRDPNYSYSPSAPKERPMKQCEECEGKGSTKANQKLENIIADLIRCGIPEMEELLVGLGCRPAHYVFGHDWIDIWHIRDAIIKAAGLPEKWGQCPSCEGKGEVPDDSYVPDAEDAGDEKQHREREEEIIEGRK